MTQVNRINRTRITIITLLTLITQTTLNPPCLSACVPVCLSGCLNGRVHTTHTTVPTGKKEVEIEGTDKEENSSSAGAWHTPRVLLITLITAEQEKEMEKSRATLLILIYLITLDNHDKPNDP
jgi:hypothetical protein